MTNSISIRRKRTGGVTRHGRRPLPIIPVPGTTLPDFYLTEYDRITKSPMTGIETPKREKHSRPALTHDEYSAMLSLAGASVRDYAILQVFLQTGIRVSELVALTVNDVAIADRVLHVRAGKGMVARSIELERKATQAVKNYLSTRPSTSFAQLFLNRDNAPISERGVRKLVAKYLRLAGIKKKASALKEGYR
jgi:integrase/recombinase XerD